LGQSRSDDVEPPGTRRRNAVPLGDLLPFAGTAGCGGRFKRGAPGQRRVPASHRDRNRPRRHLLEGRGPPPAILRKTRPFALSLVANLVYNKWLYPPKWRPLHVSPPLARKRLKKLEIAKEHTLYEDSSATRPDFYQAGRRAGSREGGHHHPRHGQGKAAGR